MRKKKRELVSFRATVVETETYDRNGEKLYHATLDSMKGDHPRQAQFFGLKENIFRPGDIHIVTFSEAVGKSKGKVTAKKELDLEAEKAQAIKQVMDKLESQTVN